MEVEAGEVASLHLPDEPGSISVLQAQPTEPAPGPSTPAGGDAAEEGMLPADFECLADGDTVSYVVGALLSRLGCAECNSNLTENTEEHVQSPRNFTDAMTFDSATIIHPRQDVIQPFGSRLHPLQDYFEKTFTKQML